MNKTLLKKDKYIYMGSLSFSFAALLLLLSQSNLSTYQQYAIYVFAVCVPQLAVITSALFIQEIDEREVMNKIPTWFTASSVFLPVIGLGLLFFHFGILAGSVFIISVIISSHYLNKFNWVEETIEFNDKSA